MSTATSRKPDYVDGTSMPDMTSLGEAREWLRGHIDDGAYCPACTQLARVYRNRQITSSMARDLAVAYRGNGREWFHLPTALGHGGDFAKLAYWGLAEEETTVRREDGGRAGWWRVTAAGVAFLDGVLSVPKHARVYDGQLLGLRIDGGYVNVHDALGAKFDLRELLGP